MKWYIRIPVIGSVPDCVAHLLLPDEVTPPAQLSNNAQLDALYPNGWTLIRYIFQPDCPGNNFVLPKDEVDNRGEHLRNLYAMDWDAQ